VVSYGIGIDHRRSIKVSTLSGPSRLVIDVSTAGAVGSGGGSTGDGGGSLPFTGSRARDLFVTAVALLAVGAIVMALSRRTRAS
jgi:hypothetical protein